MAKSYKMIVLLYMLERGAERWTEPVTPQEVAPFFHRYLVEKEFRKRVDFSDTESRRLWAYDEAAVSSLIARMPMTKWAGARGSMTRFEDGVFSLAACGGVSGDCAPVDAGSVRVSVACAFRTAGGAVVQ
ncbi:hypothetical protein [Paenibacillus sp.]|uniref:hypothetical protein n=1 Tax=Paenibacillus sp. TaxID=58172 RepID=UPI002811F4BB|nr:hypothetical protein [Paenibacillus sp.]